MPVSNIFSALAEFKFADGAPEGLFSGYAAVFGNVDAHGDMISPGAFRDTIAERKATGRPIPMHLMHKVFGGDGLPVGVWNNIEEDGTGLRVDGMISGMNTDYGRRIFDLVKIGALGGISIGYKVRTGGATYGKKAGEPRRTLKSISLHEISLVDDPSNALSRVREVKAAGDMMDGTDAPEPFDPAEAAEDLAAGIVLFDKLMQNGGGYGSVKDMALIMDRLMDAYEDLTGSRVPDGLDGWVKSMGPTIRDVEKILRDGGLSRALARDVAERGIKNPIPRDEGKEGKATPGRTATAELADFLRDYSLNT